MAEHQQDSPTPVSKRILPLGVFFKDASKVFRWDDLGKEILKIALPAALAVAADPMASLVDTAFIGHLGAVELAAAGVSIAIYNQASRITIFPLVSITTSFVAEEDTLEKMKMGSMKVEDLETSLSDKLGYEMERTERNDILNHLDFESGAATETGNYVEMFKHNVSNNVEENRAENDGDMKPDELRKDRKSIEVLEAANTTMFENPCAAVVPVDNNTEKPAKVVKHQKRHIASASTALIFGLVLGLFQSLFLMLGAKTLLRVMGVKADSPMLAPAHTYLVTRAIGAPAFLLALAMQGIFRGLKDTTTPLYVILGGYAVNIAMDPILIFLLKFGIKGAAISHIFAQYLMAFVLFLTLMRRVELVPPSLQVLYAQFGRFLKNGTLLLFRVVAVTFCVTLAASLAAHLGTTPMAAFQACLQVWLTSSLLADGLAVGGQAIVASAFAEKDHRKAQATATRVLQMSFVMGMALALIVGVGLYFGGGAFTSNVDVLRLIRIGLPFVAATQPINSLSFAFDGVNFGASDFAYCAYSLVMVSLATVATEFLLSRAKGFVGIWVALSIYMALRAFAGAWRMATGTGPWRFLRG